MTPHRRRSPLADPDLRRALALEPAAQIAHLHALYGTTPDPRALVHPTAPLFVAFEPVEGDLTTTPAGRPSWIPGNWPLHAINDPDTHTLAVCLEYDALTRAQSPGRADTTAALLALLDRYRSQRGVFRIGIPAPPSTWTLTMLRDGVDRIVRLLPSVETLTPDVSIRLQDWSARRMMRAHTDALTIWQYREFSATVYFEPATCPALTAWRRAYGDDVWSLQTIDADTTPPAPDAPAEDDDDRYV